MNAKNLNEINIFIILLLYNFIISSETFSCRAEEIMPKESRLLSLCQNHPSNNCYSDADCNYMYGFCSTYTFVNYFPTYICYIMRACSCYNSVYDINTAKCKFHNDGSGPCSSLDMCFDTSFRAICSGVCLCQNAHYVYDGTQLKCLGKNNENAACLVNSDCVDKTSVGGCVDGFCVCSLGYTYFHTKRACLAPNNKLYTCSLNIQCIDQTLNIGGCIAFKCDCASGSVWINICQACSKPNDMGYTINVNNLDCCEDNDSISGAIYYGNTCGCQLHYIWVSSLHKCKGLNNNAAICTSDSYCIDPVNGHCDYTCKCNDNYVWDNMLLKCVCAPGTSAPDGFTSCKKCSSGYFQPDMGKNTCFPCSEGEYSIEGSTSCSDCPSGTYNPSKAGSCIECPPGTYNPQIKRTLATDCMPCKINEFGHAFGQDSCFHCPDHSTSKIGATLCGCDEGYWFDNSKSPDFEYCPGILS